MSRKTGKQTINQGKENDKRKNTIRVTFVKKKKKKELLKMLKVHFV